MARKYKLDPEKEKEDIRKKHESNRDKWNAANPNQKINTAGQPVNQSRDYSGKTSITQSNYKQNQTKSAIAAGAKAGASAAKTALDTGRKAQPNAPKNSQVDEKTGKFRTDNAKNRRQQERRKGGRGYYVNQGNKEAGERIGNIVKGTAKQLGSSYMNTASMMYAAPSKGRIRKEMHVQSNRQHGTNDRRFVGKTPAEITAYRQKAKQDEAKVEKQYQKIQATADASAKELQTKASALRQSGTEDLEKAKEGMGALGKFGVDLSSQMLMWGSDAALGAVTGGGALPYMFIRSFGDASMTARESGATKGQQAFAGLAAGSVEAATEKLFSPFQAFKKTAGKGFADNLAERASFRIADTIAEKLVKKGMPKNAVYKAVKGTVKAGAGMLEEGSEEALADFAQPLYERSYDKNALKQYGTKEYWQNVGRDFGMGAAMSGVLGGGGAVMNSVKHSNTKSSEPYTPQEKSQAIQAAKAQSEESDAYKFAETLEAQQESGKEVLDAQIDDLVQKTFAEEYEINRTMQEQQEAMEQEQRRVVEEKAGDIDGYLPKKGILNEVYGRNIQNIIALRVDNNARRIEQNLVNVFHADPETAAVQAESIARIKTGTATAADFRVASVENIPARKVLMRELKMKLPATNAETMKALAEHEAVIRAVQKQSIQKEARQSARAEIFETFTMGMDETTADIFATGMEKVQLADVPKFMEAFATYYEGGRVNYNYERIPIATAYQGYITEDIKQAAYQAGNQVYLAEQEQAAAMQQQVVKGERTRGTLELSERNAKRLGKEQSNALRMVADVTGKHIVVLDQIDADGRKDVANGKYQDGVIYISAKAQTPVFDVLKHELTHNLQETAPEAYQELKDYVFRKFYESDQNRYDEMVRGMVERYAAGGVELTRAQAEDELLADATDAFFTDYNAISELVLENRSLGEKLLDGIRSLLDTFHRLAARSHSEDNADTKGKWLEEIGALKEAERLWVKALNESVGAESERGEVKYSINEKFYDEFDNWIDTTTQEERRRSGGFFNVGTVSAALKSVGVRGEKIRFDKAKIAKIMDDHSEMSRDEFKGIPEMIEHPIVVMQSRTKLNSVTILGELMARNGNAVMVSMKLTTTKRNNTVADLQVITSAYGRTNSNIQFLLDNSNILYIEPDKKRTNNWLASLRVQFPSEVTEYGSIGRITYVNEKGNSFSENRAIAEAFKKAETKKKPISAVDANAPTQTSKTRGTSVSERSLATATDEQVSVNTPKATSGTASNNSISDFSQKSNGNEKFSLNSTDIREFNMTKQLALDNMRTVTEMESVTHLDGSGFEKQDGRSLSQAVMDYYGGNEFTVENPYLGKIKVGKRGIKSDTQHRPLYGAKIESFKALKEVIANGEIINVTGNYDNKAYDRVMLAAPISIAEAEYYMGVIVKRNRPINSQTYYIHDVILQEKNSLPLKDTAELYESRPRIGETVSPYIILQQLNNINNLTEKNIITDEGRFQLKTEAEKQQEKVSNLEKEVERLEGEFKRSKIAVPDSKQTGREVTKLMDAYIGKRLPTVHQSIMADMNQLFTEMRKKEGNWNLVDDLCRNVADKIVSNMEVLHDEYWQQYTDLRKSLKNTTLKLNETYWNDVADFEDLRKAHFGTLRLSQNNGVSIDTYYQELAESYPELFDASEYTNEVDQLYNIIDTIEGMKPYTEDYSEGEIAEFADTVAADVLQLAYDLNQKETFADKKYNEKMEAIKKERLRANEKQREKLDKQAELLTSKARADKESALAKQREKNLEKIDKIKEHHKEMLKNQRQRANERLEKKDQFYKDKIREAREKNRDRKDRKYYTSRIEAYSQWLSDSLLRPTETKHIPESYRKAVAEMLDSFDFGTKRKDKYAEKNGPSKKTIKLAALNKAYKEIMAQESSMLEADDEISALIDDLSVALEGKRFEELETEQLVGVYKLVKNIRFAISSVNKTFSDGLKENISEYAQQVMSEASGYHHENYDGLKKRMGDFIQWTNTTSKDAFMLMGKTMDKLYQNMRNGLDRHIDNTTAAIDFVTKLREQYHVKDWIDDNARPQKFEVGGRTIELVPAQVMSLYCLMKREQAVSHIIAGSGMTSAPIPVIDKKHQKITKGWSQRVLNTSHVLPTMEEVERIIGTLTTEQKAVADELQKFMVETCAEWGNETSMKLYGYKKFREQDYFPIKSSDAFLSESFDNTSNPAKIKNVGFTKNTVVNASNPIVLDDIFNVFTQHVNTMSMYNALVPAITDFEKVYNYKARNADGKQVASVHRSLEQAFGKGAIDYISQFMKDVNQNHVKNRDHEMANKLVANYKKAKIGANFRVLVQQPTAVFRANAVMNPKYLIEAAASVKTIPGFAKQSRLEMQEHCPIARWKSWGFYNTDVARDMRDIFLDKKNIVDKLFMDMYGKADDFTWSLIWRATKKEIEATKPELEKGSEAYWKAVSERFSYVVDRTQVVDSVFHRSQIMRKTDLFSKTATSFMAEPTKTWNLLKTEYTLAARDWQAGNKAAATKRVSRVMATHLITAAMTGAASALIDALRGGGEDDDDKEFLEKWASYAGEGFFDNAVPAGLLPMVRDVSSLLQGYDVARMDMAGFSDLINSFQYWKSDTATTYFALKKTVSGIASVTGLPIGSLWRDAESIAKEFAKLVVPEEEVEFVMTKLRYNMQDSRNRSKFAKVYAKANENGNSETARKIRQEMLGAGADSKEWDSSVKTQRQNVIAGKAANLLNKGDEAEAKKLIRSYCAKYDWNFEEIWAKVLEQSAKRKSTFQKAYEDTLGKLIRGEA